MLNAVYATVMLSVCSGMACGQTLGWLPMADLPPSQSEASGGNSPPAAAFYIPWDEDGPGPLPDRLVTSGVLQLTVSGGQRVAALSENGWAGLNSSMFISTILSMAVYQSTVDATPRPVVGPGNGAIHVYRDGTWNLVGQVNQPRAMCVGDLDGAGPQPAKLFIGGTGGVFAWDGVTLSPLSGGASVAGAGDMLVWDEDGDGPQAPRLYVGTRGGTNTTRLLHWTGSAWVVVATFNDSIYSLSAHDFDGEGPAPAEMVVAGRFTMINSSTPAQNIARWSSGVWTAMGNITPSPDTVYALTSFDPDGDGPMPTWLVAGGNLDNVLGGSGKHLAAYYDDQWHDFPEYVNSEVTALSVSENFSYSDTPQLIVNSLQNRPCVGRFGLCDGPAGINGDAPSRSRQPSDESASFGVNPAGDELTFRWYKGNTALVDGATASGSTISGVYSPQLNIDGVKPQDAGDYHVVVFNAAGQARSRDVSVSIGCRADFNIDNTVDLFDYLDFVTAFATNDPDADFNADRTIDFFDYLDFVNQFASGC